MGYFSSSARDAGSSRRRACLARFLLAVALPALAAHGDIALAGPNLVGPASKVVGDRSALGRDGAPEDRFGAAFAVDGNFLLAGIPDDDIAGSFDHGSVYLFERVAEGWRAHAKLVAPPGSEGTRFGASVALRGDVALVGAPGDAAGGIANRGAVHVFERGPTGWQFAATLRADNPSTSASFGFGVALGDGFAVVGAPLASNPGGRSGSVYVLRRSAAGWVLDGRLDAPAEASAQSNFGYAIALSGTTLLVGAPYDQVGGLDASGSAFAYRLTATGWLPDGRMVSNAPRENGLLGLSVAIDGENAALGAPVRNLGFAQVPGNVVVYRRIASQWLQDASLAATGVPDADGFGVSVSLKGDRLVVAAPSHDHEGVDRQGAAFVFDRGVNGWAATTKLVGEPGFLGFASGVRLDGARVLVGWSSASEAGAYGVGAIYDFASNGSAWSAVQRVSTGVGGAVDLFGRSVAIDEEVAVVGAANDDVGSAADVGTAHVFERVGGEWTRVAMLTPQAMNAESRFGTAVAVAGDLVVVGADRRQGVLRTGGTVEAFARTGAAWERVAVATPDPALEPSAFGAAVATDGARVVVGAPEAAVSGSPGRGAVIVFDRVGDLLVRTATLVDPSGLVGDEFGHSVAISGDTILVGAPGKDVDGLVDRGAVLPFQRSGDAWVALAPVSASEAGANSGFGFSIALSGPRAVVGQLSLPQRAHVYTVIAGGLLEQQVLAPATEVSQGGFGRNVATNGRFVLVGAPGVSNGVLSVAGSTHLFDCVSLPCRRLLQLQQPSGRPSDLFGRAVALSNTAILVGSPLNDADAPFGNIDEGAAFVYAFAGDLLYFDSFESGL